MNIYVLCESSENFELVDFPLSLDDSVRKWWKDKSYSIAKKAIFFQGHVKIVIHAIIYRRNRCCHQYQFDNRCNFEHNMLAPPRGYVYRACMRVGLGSEVG